MKNIITDIAGMIHGDREKLKANLRMFIDRGWQEPFLPEEQTCAREAVHHLMELYITVIANGRFVSEERTVNDWMDYASTCREFYEAEEWFDFANCILNVASVLMIAAREGFDSL